MVSCEPTKEERHVQSALGCTTSAKDEWRRTHGLWLEEPRPKKRSRVKFAEHALSYSSNRTQKDILHSWYTPMELYIFRQERKDFIKYIQRVNFDRTRIDETRISLRGFEAYFSVEDNKAFRRAKYNNLNYVLKEQDVQRRLGFQNPEVLREISSQQSKWARQVAQHLGTMDALESREILREFILVGKHSYDHQNLVQEQHADREKEL